MGEYGRIDSVTDRRLNVFSFVYSEETGGLNAGNVSSVTAPAGPNSAPARVTSYTYDAYDRVTEVEDHGTHTAQFQLDGNDRVTRQTDPRGKYADFNFVDGRLDNINLPTNQGSGANRRQTTFLHDESGRILEVIGKTGTKVDPFV